MEPLTSQLRALGLGSGRDVMVHASLRRLGPVPGGASAVVDAVMDAIGPDGTMLMMIAADDSVPFDRLTSPADPDNGALAEAFRTHAGVEVNDHPACRFAALGPASAELLRPQPLHDYYGAGSPLERLVARRGAVLRLGADLDTVTLTHHAEHLARLPYKRRVTRRYVRADTGPVDIDGIDDSDGIAEWAHGDYFPQILVDFLATGAARVGPVGGCTAELFDAAAFVESAVRWIERELATASAAG